jgi:hypothetical protein
VRRTREGRAGARRNPRRRRPAQGLRRRAGALPGCRREYRPEARHGDCFRAYLSGGAQPPSEGEEAARCGREPVSLACVDGGEASRVVRPLMPAIAPGGPRATSCVAAHRRQGHLVVPGRFTGSHRGPGSIQYDKVQAPEKPSVL